MQLCGSAYTATSARKSSGIPGLSPNQAGSAGPALRTYGSFLVFGDAERAWNPSARNPEKPQSRRAGPELRYVVTFLVESQAGADLRTGCLKTRDMEGGVQSE